VPGLTDDDENVTDVAGLVASLGVRRVDVLPYHRAGLAKYERLERRCRPDLLPAATARDAESAAALMRGFGLDVRIGGSA
jgi:pyruvate formate lyase activating enzyme